MDNKYYTPDISEFNIGFEFEANILTSILGMHEESNWIQLKFMDMSREDKLLIGEFFKTGNFPLRSVRVKYLDQSDIESFGFRLDLVDGKYIGRYKKGNIFLMDQIVRNKIQIHNMQEVEYEGIVKNKSELKTILLRHKIINE